MTTSIYVPHKFQGFFDKLKSFNSTKYNFEKIKKQYGQNNSANRTEAYDQEFGDDSENEHSINEDYGDVNNYDVSDDDEIVDEENDDLSEEVVRKTQIHIVEDYDSEHGSEGSVEQLLKNVITQKTKKVQVSTKQVQEIIDILEKENKKYQASFNKLQRTKERFNDLLERLDKILPINEQELRSNESDLQTILDRLILPSQNDSFKNILVQVRINTEEVNTNRISATRRRNEKIKDAPPQSEDNNQIQEQLNKITKTLSELNKDLTGKNDQIKNGQKEIEKFKSKIKTMEQQIKAKEKGMGNKQEIIEIIEEVLERRSHSDGHMEESVEGKGESESEGEGDGDSEGDGKQNPVTEIKDAVENKLNHIFLFPFASNENNESNGTTSIDNGMAFGMKKSGPMTT